MKPSPTKSGYSRNYSKKFQIHNSRIKISPRKNNIFHPDFFSWQDMNLYVRLRTFLSYTFTFGIGKDTNPCVYSYIIGNQTISDNCAKRSFRPWVPENLMSVRACVFRPDNNWFLRGGYGGCLTASVYWQFELLILKDPKVDRSIMKLRACIGRLRVWNVLATC